MGDREHTLKARPYNILRWSIFIIINSNTLLLVTKIISKPRIIVSTNTTELRFFKKFAHLLCQMLLIGLWKFTVDIYFAQIWITAYIIIKWLGVRLNIITKFNFYENFINLSAISFKSFFRRQYASLKSC